MLKKLIVTLVLLSFVAVGYAQDDENKSDDTENKRPSWSKGLPERQKTTDLKTTEFKPEIDNEIELDMSEFGLQEKPKIEIELPINSEIGVRQTTDSDAESEVAESVVESEPQAEAEPIAIEPVEVEPVETEAVVVEEVPVETPAEESSNLILEAEEPVIETNLAEEAVSDSAADEAVVLSEDGDEETANEAVAETNDQVAEPVAAAPVESEAVSLTDEAETENTTAASNAEDATNLDVLEEADTNDENVASSSENASYEWKIVERKAVVYPPRAAIENLEGWVDLEITINPAGEVVSASPVKYSRKGRIFGKNAVQSVNDWLFEPPSSYGISDNITRIYRIEFDL